MSEVMSEKEIKELVSHTKSIIKEGLESDDDIQLILMRWLDLYQKEKEKNKKGERKWDEEKYLIELAENELLGYIQGYEDGFNHNSTAVQQIIKGRESEIHQLEIERLKKIISKLKKENEELDQKFKYAVPDEIVDELYISKDKIREILEKYEHAPADNPDTAVAFYSDIKKLLEENNGKQM